jgi:hypothetical protein
VTSPSVTTDAFLNGGASIGAVPGEEVPEFDPEVLSAGRVVALESKAADLGGVVPSSKLPLRFE